MASGSFTIRSDPFPSHWEYIGGLTWWSTVDWTSEQIPGKNASLVTATCSVLGPAGDARPCSGRLFIGEKYTEFKFQYGKNENIATCSAEIEHGMDGNATVGIGVKITADTGNLAKFPIEGSQTVTLDNIPSFPSAVSLSKSVAEPGDFLQITIDQGKPEYRHDLTWNIGSASQKFATNVETGYRWAVPDFTDYADGAPACTCTIVCETYNQGEPCGSTTASFKVNLSLTASSISPSAYSVKMCKQLNISIARCRTDLVHTLTWELGSGAGTIAANAQASYTWAVPDLSEYLGGAQSSQCIIRCYTYRNGVLIGHPTQTSVTMFPPDVASHIGLSATEVQMGKHLIISLINSNLELTNKLQFQVGSYTGTISISAGRNTDWEVPDLAAYCNNELSAICTIICTTSSGTDYVGRETAEVTLIVQDPVTPVHTDTVVLGQTQVTETARASVNFSVELYLQFPAVTGDTYLYADKQSADTVYWAPGYDLAAQIIGSEGTGTIIVKTYNGTALVGSRSTTVRVRIPDDPAVRPRISLITMAPVAESLPEAVQGIYIRGKTGVRVEVTAGSEYSSIAEYEVQIGSITEHGNPAVISKVIADGNIPVKVTVTDARGLKSSETQYIYVYPYSAPKVVPYSGMGSVVCERANSEGTLTARGTYLLIKAGGAISSLGSEAERNSGLLQYRWRQFGGAWNSWVVLSTGIHPEAFQIIPNIVVSTAVSYEVQLQCKDILDESVMSFQITTEAVSFALYDGVDGAAFGKYPEAPHIVDIAQQMSLRVRGGAEKVLIGNNTLRQWALEVNYPVGSCWLTTTDSSPQELLGGRWERCPANALDNAGINIWIRIE